MRSTYSFIGVSKRQLCRRCAELMSQTRTVIYLLLFLRVSLFHLFFVACTDVCVSDACFLLCVCLYVSGVLFVMCVSLCQLHIACRECVFVSLMYFLFCASLCVSCVFLVVCIFLFHFSAYFMSCIWSHVSLSIFVIFDVCFCEATSYTACFSSVSVCLVPALSCVV